MKYYLTTILYYFPIFFSANLVPILSFFFNLDSFNYLALSVPALGLYISFGPQSRTLQPVRGEGYEPAHKSRANAETHPRLGAGGCRGVSER